MMIIQLIGRLDFRKAFKIKIRWIKCEVMADDVMAGYHKSRR